MRGRRRPVTRAHLVVGLLLLGGCGPMRVQYSVSCAATCSGVSQDIAAASGSVCALDTDSPNAVAQANVNACLSSARSGCPSATCACTAERTTTPCQ